MKLKWTMNGVTFNRSNYRPVIARFDNTTCWLSLAACTTTIGFRAAVRELATAYGAKTVELKYFYDDDKYIFTPAGLSSVCGCCGTPAGYSTAICVTPSAAAAASAAGIVPVLFPAPSYTFTVPSSLSSSALSGTSSVATATFCSAGAAPV